MFKVELCPKLDGTSWRWRLCMLKSLGRLSHLRSFNLGMLHRSMPFKDMAFDGSDSGSERKQGSGGPDTCRLSAKMTP